MADLSSLFREVTEGLAHGDTIRGFSLVSRSMESPKGEDKRFRFVMAADGLPGKTAEINVNVTKLLAVPAFRDRAFLISRILLAIQENLEAGGHRYLAESGEDVVIVNVGEYE
jgi:hypothetical protein